MRGKDGWLFFAPELHALSRGRFWGEAAAAASHASSPEYADPLPAILDFKQQLDTAGIELLFVPVPAKAAIYPDKLPGDDGQGRPEPGAAHREFYELLRRRGVQVLDLTSAFLHARAGADRPLFCRQDTHWSGAGCELAAAEIVRVLGRRPWMADLPVRSYTAVRREVEITGDLWRILGDETLARERLALTFVWDRQGGSDATIRDWRESPVLLLGDSHNLVFHSGDDLHARGAGLADHLAHLLGFPMDVVAVRGSGATPSRINLLRRRDNLGGKRIVIWCISMREFTEGQGWRKVPVLGPRSAR